MEVLSPCSKSTKVSASQIFCRISSRVTTSPARLNRSSRIENGWPRSLTAVPFLDNSWAQVRASNGPKRKINEGVSMAHPAGGCGIFDRGIVPPRFQAQHNKYITLYFNILATHLRLTSNSPAVHCGLLGTIVEHAGAMISPPSCLGARENSCRKFREQQKSLLAMKRS